MDTRETALLLFVADSYTDLTLPTNREVQASGGTVEDIEAQVKKGTQMIAQIRLTITNI